MRIVSGLQLRRLLGDWRGSGSAYQTLAQSIAGLIRDGRLPVEARLPAERELAGTLQVSRTTVAGAYERLRTEGYLRSRRGSGSVVTLPDGEPVGGRMGWVPSPSRDGVLDLAVASMPAPQPALDRAARAAVELLPRYATGLGYEARGLGELRETIAGTYRRRGLPTSAEEILVTNGGQHAWDLLLRLLSRPGERVLIECPTYPNAFAAVVGSGARAVPVGLGDADWDVELFTDTMRQANPALVYLIPDYQNPTGRLMPDATRAALVASAGRTGTYLISDESFTELGFDGGVSAPLASFEGGDRVICLGSMSKPYWGGLRIGWIRAGAPLIRRLSELRAIVDHSQPVFEQLLACELLKDADSPLVQRRLELTARRDALIAALHETLPDWSFRSPGGGMALWVRLEAAISTALAAAALRHGVIVAPGPRFGTAASMEHYLRIPYTLSPDELALAVARLSRAHLEVFRGGRAEPSVHIA